MSKINADQLTQITVNVPELRFPGARSQASFWESAAYNLKNGYEIGGDGVKEAVAFILKQIGEQLARGNQPIGVSESEVEWFKNRVSE